MDLQRRELRLRRSHPILLRNGDHLVRRRRPSEIGARLGKRMRSICRCRKECRQPRYRPMRIDRHAGFAVDRDFGGRTGLRVGDFDRQRPGFQKRVAPRVGGAGVGIEAEGGIGRGYIGKGYRGQDRCAERGIKRDVASARELALGELFLEVVDRRPAAEELVVQQKLLMQRNVGLDSFDDHFR
jgi:hypothetical protein